jgi:hypothetical protein
MMNYRWMEVDAFHACRCGEHSFVTLRETESGRHVRVRARSEVARCIVAQREGLTSVLGASVRSLIGCIQQLGGSPIAVVLAAGRQGPASRLRVEAGERRVELRIEPDLGLLIAVSMDLPILLMGRAQAGPGPEAGADPGAAAEHSEALQDDEANATVEVPRMFREYLETVRWDEET